MTDLPTLDALGRDLLRVPAWRRAVSLVAPFLLTALFFVLASQGEWLAALVCPMLLSFLTYGSISLMGSWIFPVITAYIPHDARATSELTQTKLFRGKVLSILALEHLYHLEHHLYPGVPHHNWPELAVRLDPFFERAGLRPIKLLF
jgi:fatty acid desaturase